MKAVHDVGARKRAVNLTLNEDLVKQAKAMTNNLSGVVESLLAEYVARERKELLTRSESLATTIAAWNEFNTVTGSIADEYSSL